MKTFINICKMTSTEAYRQGWIDGHSADSKYPQTVTILGYDLEGLSKIISWYEGQEKHNMTRKEAIENCCHGIAYPEAFIQALEALGLIKFDEPKRKYIFFPHPDAGKDNVSVYQDDAIKTLNEYGYVVGKEADLVPYKTPDDAAFVMELKQQGYRIIKEDNPK